MTKQRFFDAQAADRPRVHRMSHQDGCGAIHAIGNGEIMLYGRGPEWMQVLGAPYSCPTAFSLVAPAGAALRCASHRRARAGSWTHQFAAGTMTDCASRAHHCIARHWDLTEPVTLALDSHDFPIADQAGLFPADVGAWLITIPGNAAVYNDYPLTARTYVMVLAQGGCQAQPCAGGLRLTFSGTGTLYVTGARSYPACVAQMLEARGIPFDDLLAEADAEDAAFLRACEARRQPLKEHPQKARVLEAAEDVALLVRAQQHEGGGVQAGHNYHLAYVRDQYGVSRGLLALGAWDAARAILAFYRDIFARQGRICNAHAMGIDGIVHVHENDDTEITGYLLLQATDTFTATGDADFFRSLCPMLDWALRAQLDCLHRHMLPFNGDETYIAGRILPRTLLNQGSFEATLLFITGGTRYIETCGRLHVKEPWMDEALLRIQEAAGHFEENFRRGDHYVTNALSRLDGLTEPGFRHGVCYNEDSFGWLHREAEGCYFCPQCTGTAQPKVTREEYALKSTLLMAPFIQSDQLDEALLRQQTHEFLREYRDTGRLPSLPGGTLCLGYDFGLLLFAAAHARYEADDLLAQMLSYQDACGAWSEYYAGPMPTQTRCRPWESAMNIAGALRYLTA